ncbi:hypothetical protein DF223_12665 [Mycetocola zhujimingii]|uniref:Uncharacterized protein n=2 Tax=Mycetocola zhujimingii TaxID=2079792 RepID=A0A2U1TC21_9MICO|nr:hypothetical protein DF223_12665 [Mycetocola zhujimingii]
MAGTADKAAAFARNGGAKAKAGATKLYAIASDPAVQAKAKQLFEDGKRLYQAATGPEAKRFYRQAATVVKKVRRK